MTEITPELAGRVQAAILRVLASEGINDVATIEVVVQRRASNKFIIAQIEAGAKAVIQTMPTEARAAGTRYHPL